jgi:hypothetical protein
MPNDTFPFVLHWLPFKMTSTPHAQSPRLKASAPSDNSCVPSHAVMDTTTSPAAPISAPVGVLPVDHVVQELVTGREVRWPRRPALWTKRVRGTREQCLAEVGVRCDTVQPFVCENLKQKILLAKSNFNWNKFLFPPPPIIIAFSKNPLATLRQTPPPPTTFGAQCRRDDTL